MKLRMLLFLCIALLVLAGSCAYMARRSMALCPTLQRHPAWVWGAVATFLLLQFAVPLIHRVLGARANPLYWLSYSTLGLVSTYFLYLAGADLLQWMLRRGAHAPACVAQWAFFIAVGLTLISAGIGLVQCMRPVSVHEVEVPIPGLPEGLDGFRIVQISDLHLGPLLPAHRVEGIVARANGLTPDLVAVTGDLADGNVEEQRPCLAALGRLQAVHGVMFVTGNHEYYSGVKAWLQAVQALGWRTLLNEHVLLQHRDAQLAVAGLPDPTGRGVGLGPDLPEALRGLEPGVTKVLLSHPPTGAEQAGRAGVSLQLSGHTHGGQYFPWSLVVRALFDHPIGLHRQGPMWIYTSPGTGFWGPPDRFLVPPEITLIVLRRSS